MKIIRQSFTAKLFIIFLVLFIFAITVLAIQQVNTTTELIESEALEKAKIDSKMSLKILDLEYPGVWSVKEDGFLYKGSLKINDNFSIVDEIAELTDGNTVTIFQDNVRVTTNVVEQSGELAIGSLVSEEVAQKVLIDGENFYGNANVLGNTYQTAYIPLKNNEGDIVGIFYTGEPDADERIKKIKNDILQSIIAVALGLLIVVFIILFIFTRPLLKRVKQSVKVLDQIAEGNLLVEVPSAKSYDEIDRILIATQTMKSKLYELIEKVSITTKYVNSASQQLVQSAEQTSMASAQIAHDIQEVTVGSANQATSVEHGLVSIDEISKGMNQSTEVIQLMSEYATDLNQNAIEGQKTVEEAIEQIKYIGVNANEVSEDISKMHQYSYEIKEIVSIINEISSQTQLLALNAAIEAAHAGEAGQGFNVVAMEVRKLADQSIHSTEKIKSLIETLQEQANTSVIRMNSTSEVIQKGINNVIHSGEVFSGIVGAIGEISARTEDIVAVAEEVQASTEQMVHIMKSIQDITEVTSVKAQNVNGEIEEQTASMQEVSASSVQLNEMSKELSTIVSQFKL